MSELSPVSCQWDRCREEFPTRDELLLHITEEHIKPMKAMLKDDIIIMKKLDKAKCELDDITSSTLELSAQSESAASPAIQRPRSAKQPSSPADNLAAVTVPEPPSIETNGGPDPSSINGRFERKYNLSTDSPDSSQDIEQQLTQEDSMEHAVVNSGTLSTSVDAPQDSLTSPLNTSSARTSDIDRGVKFLTGCMSVPSVVSTPASPELARYTQSFLPQTQATYYSQDMDSGQSL